MADPSVCVIVLNWNNSADTIACLASLERVDYPSFDVLVVDNGSTDQSVAAIRKRFPSVKIIETGKNLGFSGGNNVGIRHALSSGVDFVLLLNNDTVVQPSFLTTLVEFMLHREEAGAVQPVLIRLGQDGVLDSLGQEIGPFVARDVAYGQTTDLIPAAPREIFGPCHAATLFRREVFDRVGLMDERFFMVFEDLDYSWRMREQRIVSWLEPRSVVYHKRGASGSGQTTNDRVRYHVGKNALYVKLRYHPIHVTDLVATLKTLLIVSVSSIKRRSARAFWSFALDALVHRVRCRRVDQHIYEAWARR